MHQPHAASQEALVTVPSCTHHFCRAPGWQKEGLVPAFFILPEYEKPEYEYEKPEFENSNNFFSKCEVHSFVSGYAGKAIQYLLARDMRGIRVTLTVAETCGSLSCDDTM